MKKCPKCNREYSDRTLEYCLEDGARLVSPVLTKTSEETVVLPNTEVLPNFETNPIEPAKATKVQELKEKAVDQGYKVLEIIPIVFALIHNYWQWLYLDKQRFSTVGEFLLSVNFVVWLLFLLVGTGLSIFAIKLSKNKGFAVTSLIILAINLLLIIIPRR
jgi:magnesium-transporting ATPase (P-type)